MNRRLKISLIFALIFSFNIHAHEAAKAEDAEMENGNAELFKALDSFKINKDEIRKSLENLKATGKISNADYLKSLDELNKMDDKQIDDLSKKAVDIVKSKGAGAADMPIEKPKK